MMCLVLLGGFLGAYSEVENTYVAPRCRYRHRTVSGSCCRPLCALTLSFETLAKKCVRVPQPPVSRGGPNWHHDS